MSQSFTYFVLNLTEEHFPLRQEEQIQILPHDIDKQNENRNKEEPEKPKETVSIQEVGNMVVLQVGLRRNDCKVGEHPTDRNGHRDQVRVSPLMVEIGHLQLQRIAQTHIDCGAHLVQSVVVEGQLHGVVEQQTEDDGIEESIPDPKADRRNLQVRV